MMHPHGQPRLGVAIDIPGGLLVEHLNLPKDTGLVVAGVGKDSPAAKAGIKKNDILLQMGDQSVPRSYGKLVKMINKMEAKKPFDIVVLRKGKKQVIKGVKLPEVPKVGEVPGFPFPPGAIPKFPTPFPGAKNNVVMTTTRNKDKFTCHYHEGPLSLTITGKVTKDAAEVSKILLKDGGKSQEYTAVKDVPEAHRKRVQRILEMIHTGKIEIKSEKK